MHTLGDMDLQVDVFAMSFKVRCPCCTAVLMCMPCSCKQQLLGSCFVSQYRQACSLFSSELIFNKGVSVGLLACGYVK